MYSTSSPGPAIQHVFHMYDKPVTLVPTNEKLVVQVHTLVRPNLLSTHIMPMCPACTV